MLDTLVAEYRAKNGLEAAVGTGVSLMDSDASKMSKAEKIALLQRLRAQMKVLMQAQAELRNKGNSSDEGGMADQVRCWEEARRAPTPALLHPCRCASRTRVRAGGAPPLL